MSEHITLFSKKLIISQFFGKSPTFAVFAATVAAYVVAILYESSYLSVFGIGPDIIEISPIVLFYSILIVMLAYCALEVYVQLHHFFQHREKVAKQNKSVYGRYAYQTLDLAAYTVYTIVFLLLTAGVTPLASLNKSTLTASIVLLGVFIVLSMIIPVLIGIKQLIAKKSMKAALIFYFERLDKHNKKVSETEKSSRPWVNENVMLYIFFAFITIFLPIAFATSYARQEQSYYVWSEKGDIKSLVIKHYGRSIVIKDYDTKQKKFKDGFTLANTDQIKTYANKYRVEKWSN